MSNTGCVLDDCDSVRSLPMEVSIMPVLTDMSMINVIFLTAASISVKS